MSATPATNPATGPVSSTRPTIAAEPAAMRGSSGTGRLNGLESAYGRQQASGQWPARKVPSPQVTVAVGARRAATAPAGAAELDGEEDTAVITAVAATRPLAITRFVMTPPGPPPTG
ncbi:hypothetical protein GCM10020358_59670 [Amorphoplanes nipponensis]|uniref:Uncharacterized protein n=1 Tax=Actinoplanes nipponensis TaxID=135950 RepID=A0A919JCN4_9ACTN|nr:hypothetical protein Ani05nite_04790 [Actinoplanes nipponensis]